MGEMIREYAYLDHKAGLINTMIAHTLCRYAYELGLIFFMADERTRDETIRRILSLKGIGRKRFEGILSFAHRHKYIDWTIEDWRNEPTGGT